MEVSVKQNKKEDYNKNVAYLLKDFSEQSKEIDNLLDSGKSMEKKAVKLKELTKLYFELVDKINNLDYALTEDIEIQKNVGKAMLSAKSGVEVVQMGLEKEDKDLVNVAREDLESSSKLVDKVTKELDKKK
ncbi:hypothetical protein [Bacillus cereus group sp. BfR-BA-01310]|uniref:hypothetical protein n=1 Tax=Bacillus cereus group sp. BfR-BA-01310 TaxID=2920287 RepID=UPI001F55E02B|nr:hypothetical protein [Bacillus cereus group sp. BfR-BA-01310]